MSHPKHHGHHPPPAPVPGTTLYVLVSSESQGSLIKINGIFTTEAAANAFALTLPPPASDRISIPVPTVLQS